MNTSTRSIIICGLLFIMLVTNSCGSLELEKRLCPIDDLLITVSDLPGNQWEEVGSRSYRDAPVRLGIERIGTGFSTTIYGNAEENVYRFEDEIDANSGFLDLYDMWSGLTLKGTSWFPLDLPSNVKINANDIRLTCSIEGDNKVKTCWYLARYDKTVVEFIATMIIVDDNDFFGVIQTIDSKTLKCAKD
jgi:hypothetical protein